MAATASIDAIEWLRKQVEAAPDGLPEEFAEAVGGGSLDGDGPAATSSQLLWRFRVEQVERGLSAYT